LFVRLLPLFVIMHLTDSSVTVQWNYSQCYAIRGCSDRLTGAERLKSAQFPSQTATGRTHYVSAKVFHGFDIFTRQNRKSRGSNIPNMMNMLSYVLQSYLL
jgi:hypothetical protein